jgi:enoyl-CoA hydratase
MIDANTALQYGLVNYVVVPDMLLMKTTEILRLINTKAPLALAGCIKAANAVFENEDGYTIEANLFGELFGTEDLKEGKDAFINKRKAIFKGK